MTWSEIANLKGGSNPNLLDNWYFGDPINQRGQADYRNTRQTIDRWRLQRTGADYYVKVADGGIEINNSFEQIVDEPFRYLGQPMTFSVLSADGQLATLTAKIKRHEQDYVVIELLSVNHAAGVRIYWYANTQAGSRFNAVGFYPVGNVPMIFQAAKLELGDHQTLAKQTADGTWRLLDAPPNKALELLKCQRYQVVFGDSANAWQSLGIGIAAVADKVNVLVPIPLQLRANPAVRVTSNSAFLLQGMGENITAGSIVFSRMTPACVQLTVDATGAALGDVYMLRQGEDKTAQLILDANL